MPDSLPFFTVSVQVGTAHAPELHTPVSQSVASSHDFPDGHGVQVPPQSTSLSSPFFVTSVQVGTWQTFWAHTPLLQSGPVPHTAPSKHPGHDCLPQSVSVSDPFLIESVH